MALDAGAADEFSEGIWEDDEKLKRWFLGLSPQEQAELSQSLQQAPRVGPQPGVQARAFFSEADVLGYGGAAGGGKRLADSDKVQTLTGEVPVMEVEVGARVLDTEGGVQEVLAVDHARGIEFYRMEFSDGTHVHCCAEHSWLAWRAHLPRKAHGSPRADAAGRVYGAASARKYLTSQLIEGIARGYRYRVPLAGPAAGSFNRYKIDPYALGALLGDGYMPKYKGARITIHGDDGEILRSMAQAMPGFTITPDTKRPHLLIGSLSIKSPDHARLFKLGVAGRRAWEKALPDSACMAPAEWRWGLLQGLMDTDGWVDAHRCAYYTTTSPKLRDGVARLARSLGCFVTLTEKLPTYTHKGEKLKGRKAWTLRIKSATPGRLFRLERKRRVAAELKHQSLSKEIVSIEPVGAGDGACIQVSHPNNLYLTNDYTVTHNSALIALLALLSHQRTVIFRRDATQLKALIDDMAEFHGSEEGLSRKDRIFRFVNSPRRGHMAEYGGLGDPGDENKWKGRPHDLLAVDEATEVQERKVRFLMTWLRSVLKGQRCRVVLTFNPPGSPGDLAGSEGRWVVSYFAPWLDERHPNPAMPGELRYYMTNAAGQEIEVADKRPRLLTLGSRQVRVVPRSRTFLPATVEDNVYLRNTDYVHSLLSLEEPFRSMMYLGSFKSGIIDVPNQVIPTVWVDDAMARWVRRRSEIPPGPMESIGVDVARGGRDFTILAPRHGWWWARLRRWPGKSTPDGGKVAGLVTGALRDGARVCIDSVGVGASPYDILKGAGLTVSAVAGQKRKGLPKCGIKNPCRNLRSALYWMMRCVLDPANGLGAMLPYDNRLRADLIAPLYDREGGLIAVEGKEQLIKRLGHSPDDADAVVYSLMDAETPGIEKVRKDRYAPVNQQYTRPLQGPHGWQSA